MSLKNLNIFEEKINEKLFKYYNLPIEDIESDIKYKANGKSKLNLIVKALFGKDLMDELIAKDICVKTICVNNNFELKESISFKNIIYTEIIQEEWDLSNFKNEISKIFCFIIFQKNLLNSIHLKNFLFWEIPNDDLEEIKHVWQETKDKITKGVFSNFTKCSEERIVHIRPKGKNSKDLMDSIGFGPQKKYSFWLNKNYIFNNVIKNNYLSKVDSSFQSKKNELKRILKEKVEKENCNFSMDFFDCFLEKDLYIFSRKIYDDCFIEILLDYKSQISNLYDYTITKQYILSNKYKNINNYFDIKFNDISFINKCDILDYYSLYSFKNWFKKKLDALYFIEYDNNQFISNEYLQKKINNKFYLSELINHINNNIESNKIFTVKSISSNLKLSDYLFGFPLYFLASILKHCNQFNYLEILREPFFYKDELNNKFLIEEFVKEKESIDLYVFYDFLKKKYMVDFSIDEFEKYLKGKKTEKSRIYYNEKREIIYGCYELYLEELNNEFVE